MMFSDAKVYGWGTDTTWTTGVAAGEVGSMAVHSNQVAVTVEGGEVIVLTPQS